MVIRLHVLSYPLIHVQLCATSRCLLRVNFHQEVRPIDTIIIKLLDMSETRRCWCSYSKPCYSDSRTTLPLGACCSNYHRQWRNFGLYRPVILVRMENLGSPILSSKQVVYKRETRRCWCPHPKPWYAEPRTTLPLGARGPNHHRQGRRKYPSY